MGQPVNVDNFVRAETARMFDGILAQAGEVNAWLHMREPAPLDRQSVIRMNRDTLYSAAVVDISAGAVVEIPDVGDRYLSVQMTNEDHLVNRVLREPGRHEVTVEEYGSRFVNPSVRIFVDPDDPADVAAVNAVQDGLVIEAGSAGPYTHPDYDTASLDHTRGFCCSCWRACRTPAGSSGRPARSIRCVICSGPRPLGVVCPSPRRTTRSSPRRARSGHYRIVLRDVPVDGFWSISVYNRDGYFEANPAGRYSFNGVTAAADDDGAVTIDLDTDRPWLRQPPTGDGRLELRDPPVPAAPGDARRQLGAAGAAAGLSGVQGREVA